MMRNDSVLMAVMLSLLVFVSNAHADPSSASYAVSQSYMPAASAATLSSANYEIDESTIDSFSKSDASSSNYVVEGTIGIGGAWQLPMIQGITPSVAKFYTNGSASFTVSAISLDGDSLEYSVKQDSTTKVAAQSSSSLSWSLSGADQGRHTYTIQVIDPDGTVVQDLNGYVFREPIK